MSEESFLTKTGVFLWFLLLFAVFGVFWHLDWSFLSKTDTLWTNSSISHGDDLLVPVSPEKGEFWCIFGQFFAILIFFGSDPSFYTSPSFLIDISCSSEQILSMADSLVLCSLGSGEFYGYFGTFWFSDPFLHLNSFYISFIGIPCSPELMISLMDGPNVLSCPYSGELVTFLMFFSLSFHNFWILTL